MEDGEGRDKWCDGMEIQVLYKTSYSYAYIVFIIYLKKHKSTRESGWKCILVDILGVFFVLELH